MKKSLLFKSLVSNNVLIHDKYRERIALIYLSLILFLISGIMSVVNLFSIKGTLLYVTSAYSFINLIHFLISINLNQKKKNSFFILKVSFLFWTTLLFSYLFISGNPEGFSAVWLLLYPITFLFFFENKLGNIFSIFLLISITFLCWTKVGNNILQYPYNKSFLSRFPIAYIAFYFIGYSIEKIRKTTYKNLLIVTKKYEHLSKYDVLTQLYNRQLFEEKINSLNFPCNLIMLDLDHFKDINDNYGHPCGDQIIIQFASLIKKDFEKIGDCFRWGGEEFIILLNKNIAFEELKEYCINFVKKTEHNNFLCNNEKIKITTSMALIHSENTTDNTKLLWELDCALYKAKKKGRNCLVSKKIN